MGGWESTSLAGVGRGRSVEQILKILGQTLLVHLPHMELRRLCMWGYFAFPQIKPAKINLSLIGGSVNAVQVEHMRASGLRVR